MAQLLECVPQQVGEVYESDEYSIVSLFNNSYFALQDENEHVLIRNAQQVELVDGQFSEADPSDVYILSNKLINYSGDDNETEYMILTKECGLSGFEARFDIGAVYFNDAGEIQQGSYGRLMYQKGDGLNIEHKKITKEDPLREPKVSLWLLSSLEPKHSAYACQEMIDMIRNIKNRV